MSRMITGRKPPPPPKGNAAPILCRCDKCGAFLVVDKVVYNFDGMRVEAVLKCPNRTTFQSLLSPWGHSEESFDSYDGGDTWHQIDYC